MIFNQIEAAVDVHGLAIFGAVQEPEIDNVATLILLGPQEPGFWPMFTQTEEYRDGQPDPMDRWSLRVIGALAKDMAAQAFYPFGGPPYQPFIAWAQASGRSHVSPVGLLVHETAGLMVSYRGALGFSKRIDSPDPAPSPCLSCVTQPCKSACPVDAIGPEGYDVPACKADLDRPTNNCMTAGCAVRRSCPISQSYGRTDEQSAFHMRAFR